MYTWKQTQINDVLLEMNNNLEILSIPSVSVALSKILLNNVFHDTDDGFVTGFVELADTEVGACRPVPHETTHWISLLGHRSLAS